ncbi:hypothetical protein PR048_008043 [Dryococelus australis]|uniref:C-type lectin domain-containing protein n=1 Tax=Dryococelus australis TaxID=614101 RepID=A0ABQ9HVZ5_9NEOP|nr:hypothetical protein PR048_008043 [Dryococelus australis]
MYLRLSGGLYANGVCRFSAVTYPSTDHARRCLTVAFTRPDRVDVVDRVAKITQDITDLTAKLADKDQKHYYGNTARLARRSVEALDVRVTAARIAPSLLDLRRNARTGKREISEKTRRPASSCGMIPTYENPGATRPGIEPGSSQEEASCLTAQTRGTRLKRNVVTLSNANKDLNSQLEDKDQKNSNTVHSTSSQRRCYDANSAPFLTAEAQSGSVYRCVMPLTARIPAAHAGNVHYLTKKAESDAVGLYPAQRVVNPPVLRLHGSIRDCGMNVQQVTWPNAGAPRTRRTPAFDEDVLRRTPYYITYTCLVHSSYLYSVPLFCTFVLSQIHQHLHPLGVARLAEVLTTLAGLHSAFKILCGVFSKTVYRSEFGQEDLVCLHFAIFSASAMEEVQRIYESNPFFWLTRNDTFISLAWQLSTIGVSPLSTLVFHIKATEGHPPLPRSFCHKILLGDISHFHHKTDYVCSIWRVITSDSNTGLITRRHAPNVINEVYCREVRRAFVERFADSDVKQLVSVQHPTHAQADLSRESEQANPCAMSRKKSTTCALLGRVLSPQHLETTEHGVPRSHHNTFLTAVKPCRLTGLKCILVLGPIHLQFKTFLLSVGYEHYPGFGFYKYFPQAQTWDAAAQNCRRWGSRLGIVNSRDEARVYATILVHHPLIEGAINKNYFHSGYKEVGNTRSFRTLDGLFPHVTIFFRKLCGGMVYAVHDRKIKHVTCAHVRPFSLASFPAAPGSVTKCVCARSTNASAVHCSKGRYKYRAERAATSCVWRRNLKVDPPAKSAGTPHGKASSRSSLRGVCRLTSGLVFRAVGSHFTAIAI